MTNIEKLKKLGMLGDIRGRMGVLEHDNTLDSEINKMSNHEIMKEWAAWKLGSSYWWTEMQARYELLNGFDKDPNENASPRL